MDLAGGSQLKEEDADNGEAESLARDWAGLNDVSSEEIVEFDFGETCSGNNVPNSITVRLSRTKPTFLARVGRDTAQWPSAPAQRTTLKEGELASPRLASKSIASTDRMK